MTRKPQKNLPTEQKGNDSVGLSKKKTGKAAKQPKFDVLDKAIVKIKEANPELTLNGVANKIVDIGMAKTRQTIYKRYNKNEYLQREFNEIQAHEDERLLRETGPMAVDVIDTVLSEGGIRRGKKFEKVDAKTIVDTAKHVSKHHWGERIRNTIPAQVNIGTLQFAQNMILGDVTRPDDVIDAKLIEGEFKEGTNE